LEWQHITGSDADELNELRAWFSENLEKPTSFGRDKLRLGISWFKTGSTEHISRIWEMVHILERNGIYVARTTLPLCFQLLDAAQEALTEQHTSSTEGVPDLYRCPKCGGPMKVIERLTAAEIQLRSPPRISSAA
jgi:hypothetical protein